MPAIAERPCIPIPQRWASKLLAAHYQEIGQVHARDLFARERNPACEIGSWPCSCHRLKCRTPTRLGSAHRAGTALDVRMGAIGRRIGKHERHGNIRGFHPLKAQKKFGFDPVPVVLVVKGIA